MKTREGIALIRALLRVMARSKGVQIALSEEFTVEELLEVLGQLEVDPGSFFPQLDELEKDDASVQAALEKLLGAGVDLDEALDLLLPLRTPN